MNPGSDTTIQKLPENIILEILSYLPVRDRCRAGKVCTQWHRIVNDNSLWKHVNLLECRIDVTKMWKVLRSHLSPSLLTMKIRGYVKSGSSNEKKKSLSDAMLKELATRCPNLWFLHLYECNTNNLSFKSLPTSIKSLSITNSSWQPRWMKDGLQYLPQLEILNLSFSSRVDNFDLEDIAVWTNLKTLSLCGCYRIHPVEGAGLELIAKNLLKLETLNLTGTGTDDLTIHHITRHLKNLKELFLSSCTEINDSSLTTIAEGLPKLNVLDISYIDSLTMKGFESLFKSKLTFLTVMRKVRLTDDVKNALIKGFPHRIFLTA